MPRKKSKKYHLAKRIILEVLDDNERISNIEMTAQVNKELNKHLLAKVNVNGMLQTPKISNYLYNQIINELVEAQLIVKKRQLGGDMREVFLYKVESQ